MLEHSAVIGERTRVICDRCRAFVRYLSEDMLWQPTYLFCLCDECAKAGWNQKTTWVCAPIQAAGGWLICE